MMKKNKIRGIKIGIFGAVVFSLLTTSTANARSIIQYQTMIQEKFIYITLSLVFFFLIYHKIRSRVSYAFFDNRRGR